MKLNLGCGPHAIDGWRNYDIDARHYVIKHDLSRGLPNDIQPNSVDFIYTEHFIEHIEKHEALKLFKDCHRVMKDTAVMRISTPDLYNLAMNYINDDMSQIPSIWKPENPCDMMNEGMRLWGHKYLWDFGELSRLLMRAGFKSVRSATWKDSNYAALCNLEVRPFCNDLIVEVTKGVD